jgi:hypothetical protein
MAAFEPKATVIAGMPVVSTAMETEVIAGPPAWIALGSGTGVLVIGVFGIGAVCLTLYGAGLLFATGQLAIGMIAFGQVGVGFTTFVGQLGPAVVIAIGQAVAGIFAFGQGPLGRADSEAFLRELSRELNELLTPPIWRRAQPSQ